MPEGMDHRGPVALSSTSFRLASGHFLLCFLMACNVSGKLRRSRTRSSRYRSAPLAPHTPPATHSVGLLYLRQCDFAHLRDELRLLLKSVQAAKATAAECEAAAVRTPCHARLQLTRDRLADTIVSCQRRHVDYVRVWRRSARSVRSVSHHAVSGKCAGLDGNSNSHGVSHVTLLTRVARCHVHAPCRRFGDHRDDRLHPAAVAADAGRVTGMVTEKTLDVVQLDRAVARFD